MKSPLTRLNAILIAMLLAAAAFAFPVGSETVHMFNAP